MSAEQELFDKQCKRLIAKFEESQEAWRRSALSMQMRDPDLEADMDFYADAIDDKRDEAEDLGLTFNVIMGDGYVMA